MTTLFKFLISAAVCAYSTQVLHAEDTKLPYWKDIQTVAVNKEYPRTAFMTYDNRNQALTGEYENSPYYKLLNGTWNFYYADAYKDLPANIEQPDANIAWKEIKVPGNWEVQGYGVAIYTNHGYEFKPRNPQPPQLPETNPVGVYQRDIEIPADWDGRDIFLRLEGAKSGVYVYVNGQEVGYSEDSKNPAEFLINNYLKPGKNSLVIKIFRWSTGSYLECQDFWRMSGIERDVFLFSQPKTHIKDFNVVSTLDDTYKNGIFKLNVDVTNHTAANKEVTVAYELLDAAKKVVAEGNTPCPVTADGQKSISFEAALSNVKTWTSEHPNLYRLLISLKDGEKTSEIIPYTVMMSLSVLTVVLPLALCPVIANGSMGRRNCSEAISCPAGIKGSGSVVVTTKSTKYSVPALGFNPLRLMFSSLEPCGSISNDTFPPLIVFPFAFTV